jgi:peroxin-3
MFDSLRKPGSFLVKTGAVIGGAYAVRGYMRERLEEVKDKMEEERRAREM